MWSQSHRADDDVAALHRVLEQALLRAGMTFSDLISEASDSQIHDWDDDSIQ